MANLRSILRATAISSVLVFIGATASVAVAATPTKSTHGVLAATTSNPWGWPGTAQKGYLPPHEPNVHPGKVTIGILSAGTYHDHGYYQSEVTTLRAEAKKHHWDTVIEGPVTNAKALADAQNLCVQKVDLVIIGQSQIASAEAAASSPTCKGTPFWIYGSVGTVTPSPYLYIAQTTANDQAYVTGVAMGLWLKSHHETRAGFIAGPALSFTERPAQSYLAGMRSVIPGATLDAVFTGSFTATGPAITAARSMLASGIHLIYPYLGGALYPTARYITSHSGATLSGGGAACSNQGVHFAIRQVYNPGYYLAPALDAFARGSLRMGQVRTFKLGKTPVPLVQFCPTKGITAHKANARLNAIMHQVAIGALTTAALIDKTPTPS